MMLFFHCFNKRNNIGKITVPAAVLLSVLIITAGCLTSDIKEAALMASGDGWSGNEYAKIESGYIKGCRAAGNTFNWKGVPYASPPTGELRWKAPRPPEKWDDVRPANTFGARAVQFDLFFNDRIRGSEDCLYLNIWRPVTYEEKLPVYVWIHGGGNSSGRSDLEDYHGHALASRSNAVFVSLNYRLGPLGWFRHPALRTGDPLDDSGNYGLLDIIAALKWIRKNIGAFGGDPRNVTIAGESAGANNILALMVSPEASELFHKAVIQSGYRRSVSVSEAERHASGLIDYLLEKSGYNSASVSKAQIRDLLYSSSTEILLEYYKGGTGGMFEHLYHVRDGKVFPKEGYSGLLNGEPASPVPVIIGSNKEETKLFLFFNKSIPKNSGLYEAIAEAGSLNFKTHGTDSVADGLVSGGKNHPVWVYRFDWGSVDSEGRSPLPGAFGKELGAFHTLEIPFFLGTDYINGPFFTGLLFNLFNRESRKALSSVIMDYTCNFIHNGDPNIGRPTGTGWPEWDSAHNYIVFNSDGNKPLITIDNKILARTEIIKKLRNMTTEEEYGKAIDYLNW